MPNDCFMDAILLQGVKTHNLKNFDLQLPHRKLYVVTGVSGSGKSSLAFDTLYAEGQRRYVESLSAYARQFLERMEKPDVESVSGIPPAIAIEAKNVITNARSTVGTQTEINDYLRLLFARIGETICPRCRTKVTKSQPVDVGMHLLEKFKGEDASIFFRVRLGKKGQRYLKEFLPELERQGFHEYWSRGKLVKGEELLAHKYDEDSLLVFADRVRLEPKNRTRLVESLELAYRYGQGAIEAHIGTQKLLFAEGFRCFGCGQSFREPATNLFSFNSPLGACPECQGFGRVITLDWHLVVPDERKSLLDGAIEPWTKPSAVQEFHQLLKFCRRKKIPTEKPWQSLSAKQQKWVLAGIPGDSYFSVVDFFQYLEKKTYKMHVRVFLSKYRTFVPCVTCRETRLKSDALQVFLRGRNIFELQQMSIDDLSAFAETLTLTAEELGRVEPVLLEIRNRIRFLKEVGLGYLSLARLSRTLSGGEVQRIHLATSLGSALVDTLYVLDEPSVGLHERDNALLIRLLKELRDLGNTVVVVEHDRTMMEAADILVDLGPGGGEQGGEILFQGPPEAIKKAKGSLTGDYLAGRREVTQRRPDTGKPAAQITIRGAAQHNLKNIDVDIPLGKFTVITGVSGSGKSTLLYEILYRHYCRFRGRPVQELGQVRAIEGFERIDEMVLVDQTPIGRSPRSNPVTYLKAFDEIRKVFAATESAKLLGYDAGSFSFNVDGGRCDACEGAGRIKVEMHFLADVFVTCEACRGTRYKEELRTVQYRGRNIDEVLNMTVEDALAFFSDQPRIVEKLSLLVRVGLAYLRLGQSATTLSGGEAQRLKLAVEMSERQAAHILYLFDEPTTGLHYHDIHFLLEAFEVLLERGHSLVVIEHNLEVIRAADYLIDLGPDGGEGGGKVVYQGPGAGILKVAASFTGQSLQAYRKKPPAAVPVSSNL